MRKPPQAEFAAGMLDYLWSGLQSVMAYTQRKCRGGARRYRKRVRTFNTISCNSSFNVHVGRPIGGCAHAAPPRPVLGLPLSPLMRAVYYKEINGVLVRQGGGSELSHETGSFQDFRAKSSKDIASIPRSGHSSQWRRWLPHRTWQKSVRDSDTGGAE